MHSDIKTYIDNLRSRKRELEKELREVTNELSQIAGATGVRVKEKERCNYCDGDGNYWDFWAGSVPCPECQSTGYLQ